jgi:hypothetical protein
MKPESNIDIGVVSPGKTGLVPRFDGLPRETIGAETASAPLFQSNEYHDETNESPAANESKKHESITIIVLDIEAK